MVVPDDACDKTLATVTFYRRGACELHAVRYWSCSLDVAGVVVPADVMVGAAEVVGVAVFVALVGAVVSAAVDAGLLARGAM